jgi:hypothetical protein
MECAGCAFLCARMEGDKERAFAILQASMAEMSWPHWKFYRRLCIMAKALPFMPLPNQKPIFQKANQIY